jgi:hypothetical protein
VRIVRALRAEASTERERRPPLDDGLRRRRQRAGGNVEDARALEGAAQHLVNILLFCPSVSARPRQGSYAHLVPLSGSRGTDEQAAEYIISHYAMRSVGNASNTRSSGLPAQNEAKGNEWQKAVIKAQRRVSISGCAASSFLHQCITACAPIDRTTMDSLHMSSKHSMSERAGTSSIVPPSRPL